MVLREASRAGERLGYAVDPLWREMANGVYRSGDHLLVTDNVYRPSRNFCNGMLARYGVETTFFDPLIGAGIEKLFKPNTRAVFVEAPGSQSFDMPRNGWQSLTG